MTKPATTMRAWLNLATIPEKKTLAKAAKVSPQFIRHVRSGRRSFSASAAQRIAQASRKMRPELHLAQPDLCDACGVCPLLKPKPKAKSKAKAK